MPMVLFAQPTVYEPESKCSSSICWRNESPAVLLLWSAQDGSLERAQLMTHAELQADTVSFFPVCIPFPFSRYSPHMDSLKNCLKSSLNKVFSSESMKLDR